MIGEPKDWWVRAWLRLILALAAVAMAGLVMALVGR